MDIDPATIRQMLRETAESVLEEAAKTEEALLHSSMTAEAEHLWFGERRQDKIHKLRWVAGRMIQTAQTRP